MEGSRNCTIRWLLHEGEGAKNFAMRIVSVYENGLIPLHTHEYEHEVFCLEGEGEMLFEGERKAFRTGQFMLVPPDIKHGFSNEKKETLRFLCLIPGSRLP